MGLITLFLPLDSDGLYQFKDGEWVISFIQHKVKGICHHSVKNLTK